MKQLLLLGGFVSLLLSCQKPTPPLPPAGPEPHPEMVYRNLQDTAVAFNRAASFDLDGDGSKDVYCYTLLVGDPIARQDKWQWHVQSSFYANLPVNGQENIPVLGKEEQIPVTDFRGYSWYNASGVVLAQKVYLESGNPFWEGAWRNVARCYVPIQLEKASGLYNGWVEVSFFTVQEKLVLHASAVSKVPNVAVKAGRK